MCIGEKGRFISQQCWYYVFNSQRNEVRLSVAGVIGMCKNEVRIIPHIIGIRPKKSILTTTGLEFRMEPFSIILWNYPPSSPTKAHSSLSVSSSFLPGIGLIKQKWIDCTFLANFTPEKSLSMRWHESSLIFHSFDFDCAVRSRKDRNVFVEGFLWWRDCQQHHQSRLLSLNLL